MSLSSVPERSRCGKAHHRWCDAGGRVSFFAGLPGDARVNFLAARLHYDEVQLLAPFHFSPADVRVAYELIAELDLPLERLISHVYRLEEIGTAFERLDAGEGMKAMIQP